MASTRGKSNGVKHTARSSNDTKQNNHWMPSRPFLLTLYYAVWCLPPLIGRQLLFIFCLLLGSVDI